MTTSHTEAPKRRKLFEIMADIVNCLDRNDGEVTDELDAIEGEFADKVEAYNVVIKERLAKAEACKKVADQFHAGWSRNTKAAAALKERVLFAMQKAGIPKVTTQTCTAAIKVSQHVEILDLERFLTDAPDEYIRRGDERPNLEEIGKALKAGKSVRGAALATRETLVFR